MFCKYFAISLEEATENITEENTNMVAKCLQKKCIIVIGRVLLLLI